MKIVDLKNAIAELNQTNKNFDDFIWDYKNNLEDTIFQTIAVSNTKRKKEVIESLSASCELALEKRINELTKFKNNLVIELENLALKK